MEIIHKQIERLNVYARKIPPLVDLSNKTHLEPGLFLGAAIALSALIILITMGGTILSAVVTVVYPALKSIKALESKDTDEDDKHWLTYWCVFGVFTLIEEFGFLLLSFIPFYFYVKLGFFLWMMAPQTQGATIIYRTVLKLLLEKHRNRIDQIIAEVKGSALSAAKDAARSAMDQANNPQNFVKLASAASEAQN